MALIVDNATCDYAGGSVMASRALSDVSLHLEVGGLALVLGPTGSGKTTLLRAAAGLLPLASGSVTVDGAAVTDAASARGLVGLLFQRPESQFFAMTVEDDCAFGPRNLGRDPAGARADARDALASVGLDPDVFGEREPWSLSGGEARRVALAGVLAMRPRYLLLDEPTAGLDAAGCAAVCSAIATARETTGIAIVTHDPDTFASDADAILVLGSGTEAFSGDVAAFLSALPVLAAAGTAEPPSVPRALMLAEARGAAVRGGLTLSIDEAAHMLRASQRAGVSS